jgi:dual specificity tyrosine-phosphorylation-regulated kinase 2/3/4
VTLTPVMQESPASTSSPASTMADQRPKQMNKKWSFSSAISLRLHKDTSANANTSTTSPPQMSPDMDRSGAFDESTYSWNQSFASSATSEYGQRNGLASAHAGSDSSSATASRIENRSVTSITPVGLAPPASAGPASTATKPPPTNKRLTPSGIPFFRRTSSTSTQSKITPPSSDGGKASLPPVSKIPTSTSTTHTRKSMLGMHFPSMLRSSGSKRHLSQQAPVASTQEQQDYVNIAADHKAATSGWARTRGKVSCSALYVRIY